MEFKIGQIVGQKNYTQAAIWCNKNGAHIEKQGEDFIVVANNISAPTLEEQVQELESKYNMPRVIREGILANPSAYSDFNVNRAKEIELLAEELRKESAEGNVL